jgi:hypothetical protein
LHIATHILARNSPETRFVGLRNFEEQEVLQSYENSLTVSSDYYLQLIGWEVDEWVAAKN